MDRRMDWLMQSATVRCRVRLVFLLAGLGLLVGCDRGPELAVVTGTVTLNGVPLDEIRVEFMPDPEEGNVAATSTAETDAEGKFTLIWPGSGQPGAAVGSHRVVLWDYKSINSRDNPIAPRISDQFNVASRTPIRQEVKSGEQNVELKLETYQ
jgi:hypothetical protein